jgi:hypothetical protein
VVPWHHCTDEDVYSRILILDSKNKIMNKSDGVYYSLDELINLAINEIKKVKVNVYNERELHGSIEGWNENFILLDTCAAISVFNNIKLFDDVEQSENIIQVDGVNSDGESIFVYQQGETVFGKVYFSEKIVGNILSYGDAVDFFHTVLYDRKRDSFMVKPNQNSQFYIFKRTDKLKNIYF